ncbi:uncharacterized protein LOC105390605 isoform X1 [Plutella xylostella]|uniref:uncharacterized protein LOC105390605 isoform X1 n=1 Tax=Plutella xylostella TaxID=51655 RepID=UPI0020330A04|nr:uncharacterized protein LOC105390605 isoform X1 [Plutella xylostella]
MLLFKCGFLLIPLTIVISVCSQVTNLPKSLDAVLAVLYSASVAIAGKIMYDRFQHINILGSLTTNPGVTCFSNKIASVSACSMFLGFLVHLFLFLFKVDKFSIAAINIFVCAFGTLYMWMQGIVTLYATTLFYDKNLTALRQCLSNVSCLVLVTMATFGTIASILPTNPNGATVAYICLIIASLCSYSVAIMFSIFILSYEKDYKYFAEGLPSDLLLDDGCEYNDAIVCEADGLFRAQEIRSHRLLIQGTNTSKKHS